MTNQTTKTRRKPTTTAKAAPEAPVKKAPARGRQQQAAADTTIGKQGAEASGKINDAAGKTTAGTEIRGGAKQVLITEATISGRGGRPAGIEEYPFGDLTPARKEADGSIVGPSFFIPLDDRAVGRLAAARKRHKCLFWSRKVFEQVNGKGPKVEGLRIWRGTPDLAKEV